MSIYRIFNKNIDSEIELNLPHSESAKTDYTLKRLKKSPIDKDFNIYHQIKFENKPWVSFLKNGNRLAMSFHEFADFTIEKNGKTINCFIKSGTANNTFTHLFADQVIPNILTLEENVVFHSSTVKINESAVSFIAPSGTGKSTLAAYFALKDQSLISDDAILIKKHHNSYMVVPSYPGIRLWQSSLDILFEEQPQLISMSQYNNKKVVNCNKGLIKAEEKPTRLRAIYLLENAESNSIEQLSPSDSFSYLIKNLYRFDLEDKKKNEYQFRFLTEMTSNIELYKLNYSHNSGSLEEAYKLVTENSIN